jgi:hypothetical protein
MTMPTLFQFKKNKKERLCPLLVSFVLVPQALAGYLHVLKAYAT